ncbi:MAG: hypothetical protein DLM64_09725 [Solirubrobacterales bacterium]|nr:MAG: hypothetical protein DLM64_09725 [Solirubrobacterales bacterium]
MAPEGGLGDPGTAVRVDGAEDRCEQRTPLQPPVSLRSGFRLLVLRISAYGLLFLVQLLVARALGPVGRARYALTLNLANIVWVVLALSLDVSTGAMVARGEASFRAMSRFLSAATVLLGAIGWLATCVLGLVLPARLVAHSPTGTLVLAGLIVPLQMAAMMCIAVALRLGALGAFGWAALASALVQLVFVLGLVAVHGLTPGAALVGVSLGWCALAAPLLIVIRRRVGPGALVPGVPAGMLRAAVRGGLALQPATLGLYLNLRIDLVLVSAFLSAAQAGIYSLSTTLASTVFLAGATLAQSALKTQTDAPLPQANRYTTDFIKKMAVYAALAAGVVTLAAWPIVRYLFGRQWLESVVPFAILAFAAIVFTVESPARVMLARMQRPGQIGLAACAGALANIALNLALIPLAGIIGAAIASLVSYALYGGTIVLLFRRASSASLAAAGVELTVPIRSQM